MLKYIRNVATSGIAGIGIFALLFVAPTAISAQQPEIPKGEIITSWVDNGQNGRYLLQLLEGDIPAGETSMIGVVLSDSDCAPDADGINHCKNEIRFEDGSVLKGVNNHRMSVNRCLKPGETVMVSPLNDQWAIILIEGAEADQ